MQEVHDFLKKAKTFYLATVEDGQPRVRPFGAVHIFENKLYIITGKAKAVSKQMAENPYIEICAVDGRNWLRIQAVAVADDRVEAKQSMLDTYPILQGLYKADDDNTNVLYLKDAVATFLSFMNVEKVVEF